MTKGTHVYKSPKFHLTANIEYRAVPVYELRLASDGSKLTPAGDHPSPRQPGEMGYFGQNVTLDHFADELSTVTHRIVVNDTGFPGHYDLHLTMPDVPRAKLTPAGYSHPDPQPISSQALQQLETSLEQELGLKLVAEERAVRTLTVLHVDSSPN
jgi:uncharacterized protein (TIGR03435 family)